MDHEETKERREALDPVAEMESLVPPETPDPLDPQDLTDPLALEETLLLRWLEDSTRRPEEHRWA